MFTRIKSGLFCAALMMTLGVQGVDAQRVAPVPECGHAAVNAPMMSQSAPFTASASDAVSPVTHVRSWYEDITYNWYDNTAGTGTAHTNKITDPVTDPYQMFHFVKSLYTNPNVPGIKYSKANNRSYYPFYQKCPPYGINSAVTKPYENGYTVCLVKVKNSFKYDKSVYNAPATTAADVMKWFTDGVEEIDLLTDGMRVGGTSNSSGTVFQYTGELNRFFFISKQKTYVFNDWGDTQDWCCDLAPFFAMYEEFSPTTQDIGAEITDFYTEMISGEVYNVIHDCQDVIQKEHFFSMSGKEGTDYYNMNCLVFYIPDYRSQSNTRDYDPSHQPHVGLYVAKLEAEAEADPEKEHVYDVTIDWSTNLDKLCHNDVDEIYELHAIWVDPETGEEKDVIIYTGEKTAYSYEVPQYMQGYTINYVVKAVPKDATNPESFYTWSNVDDVLIPGYYDFFMLRLHHYESDFVIEDEHNYYRNYVYPQNVKGGAGYTLQEIKDGYDHFVLYRTSIEENVPIADLFFKAINGKVFYKIDYRDVEANQHPLNNTNE